MLDGLTSGSATDKIKAACENIIKAFGENLGIDIEANFKNVSSGNITAFSATRQAYGSSNVSQPIVQYNYFGGQNSLADQAKANQRLVAQLTH